MCLPRIKIREDVSPIKTAMSHMGGFVKEESEFCPNKRMDTYYKYHQPSQNHIVKDVSYQKRKV